MNEKKIKFGLIARLAFRATALATSLCVAEGGLAAPMPSPGRKCEGIFASGRAQSDSLVDQDGLLAAATRAAEERRYQKVVALTDRILSFAPRHRTAMRLRANALLALGRANDALVQADSLLRLGRDNRVALGLRVLALAALDRADEALAEARAIMRRTPESSFAAGLLGMVFFKLRRWNEVIENARRFPGSHFARIFGGRALALTERATVAIALFKHEPLKDYAAQWGLAEAYYQAGQMENASSTLVALWLEMDRVAPDELHRWPLIGLLRIAQESPFKNGDDSRPLLQATSQRFGSHAVADIESDGRSLSWRFVCDQAIAEAQATSVNNTFWFEPLKGPGS